MTEVCLEVGYASLGSFSSLFARRFGCSPAAYRRRVRRLVAVPAQIGRLYIPCCFLQFFRDGPTNRNSREAATRAP